MLQQAGIFVVVLWLVFFSAVNMKHHLRSSNFVVLQICAMLVCNYLVKYYHFLMSFFKVQSSKNILKMDFRN